MANYFTHLHLHTDYSLLDGAIPINRVVQFAKDHQVPSIALSDHGNIFGAVKFFQSCKKAGIKPVLGMEAYITEDATKKDPRSPYYHLLLLVKNPTGYRNLCQLIHYSYKHGFYFKPRIDYAMLKEHSEGLIATSTCLGGHIPQLFLKEQDNLAYQRVDELLKIFGEEDYYLEVQPADQDEQKIVNEKLFVMGKEKGLRLFASADSHYPTAEDKYAHEVMLAIQTRAKMDDRNRMSLADCVIHMRTPEEMLNAFPNHEEVVWQSGAIAERCNFDFETNSLHFPQFEIPHGLDEKTYFTQLCKQGLQERIDTKRVPASADHSLYWKRLEYEIDLIARMGYIAYFLIVSDFIKWAKKEAISVGPGRGSAAGSLVAWAIEITDIDPIQYNLLFERFLNPERVSMPDIDIDFCMEEREKVINYVREKYGHDKVCQIITFGTMMAKGVVKDVARALGMPFEEANAITDLIPDHPKITLSEAFELEPRLVELRSKNKTFDQLFDIAFRLEGLTRHASKHAAGIVITPQPVHEMLPIYIPTKTNDVVTQYAMTELESIGFLKMDFLGLKNLTLIKRVVRLIKENHNVTIDISHLPLDDKLSFELISKGNTTGVFQLESSGIRDVLRRLQPKTFEDIIAVNALYRPGPLGSGMVDDFIERRHGRQKITYLLPELEPILKETYGVIVYQEQVMKIASTIADYTLGEADILRRAMGKKKQEVMDEQCKLFVNRATQKGFDSKKAKELFDLMAYFAGYGFNKSHSAAYGMIAYQTAYLKAHYPAEFMACLISLELSNAENMAFYVQEAREMGIAVLPPDINKSDRFFTTEFMPDGTEAIRFGLHGIKNVGNAALELCVTDRSKNGSFADLLDLCVRIDLKTCNKRIIESLITAGALDQLPGNRAQKMAELGTVMDRALEIKKAKETGQMGLFGIARSNDQESSAEYYTFAPLDDWDDMTKLAKEKEMIGLYLTSQPLDRYKKELSWLTITPFDTVPKEEKTVICCGYLKHMKTIRTKKGDLMAFVTLEDYTTHAEIIVFPKLYAGCAQALAESTVFVVKGTVDSSASGCKIRAQELYAIELLCESWQPFEKVCLTLPDQWDEELIKELKHLLTAGVTPIELYFKENDATLKLRAKETYNGDISTLKTLEEKGIKIQLSI